MSSTLHRSWQQVWHEAQAKLQTARDAFASQGSLQPRILRVGQLDAELLDQELVHLLQEPLTKALALLSPSLKARFEPELALVLQLTLYKLSIWTVGSSYGAKLQNLKYKVPFSGHPSLALSGLPRRVLMIHGALTVIVPYLHARLRAHALSRAWPDAPFSDKRRKIWDFLTRIESIHSLLGLLNFIAFLKDGRYRTLADRILRMELIPSQRLVHRNVSYEFMNRQMVWHAFTEFLLFLLPLINVRAFRRRTLRAISQINISEILPAPARVALGITDVAANKDGRTKKAQARYHSLSADQCAICAENASFNLNIADSANAFTTLSRTTIASTNPESSSPSHGHDSEADSPMYPIHTPYITSCLHVYCYFCLAERMIRAADGGEIWECLRCGEPVRSVDRLTLEMEQEEGDSVDDYDFSSDFDPTDISTSGSMGSYSESGLSSEYV